MNYYKPRFYSLVVLFILSLLLWGCSSSDQAPDYESSRQLDSKPVKTMETSGDIRPAKMTTESRASDAKSRLSLPTPDAQRKVIYTANVRLTVKDYKQIRPHLEQLVAKHQGYLVNSSESKTNEYQSGNFTYRVPQAEFDAFLKEIQKLDASRPEINISGTDVTEEMVDLESRLKAKQAMEKRLLELMNKAAKTDDLLDISRQLDQTQVEIEQIKGRLQYLNNKVDFSTVHVEITQRFVAPSSSEQPLGKQMADSFLASLSGLGVAGERFLIFMAGAFPILLLLAAVGVPIYVAVRRAMHKKGV
jgi:uncharacterized coiled-coil protein SlyX